MIKIDFRRYIYNRMWFGWWFSFTWSLNPGVESDYSDGTIYDGKWQREDDTRYHWKPMILVSRTFANPAISNWAAQYGKI